MFNIQHTCLLALSMEQPETVIPHFIWIKCLWRQSLPLTSWPPLFCYGFIIKKNMYNLKQYITIHINIQYYLLTTESSSLLPMYRINYLCENKVETFLSLQLRLNQLCTHYSTLSSCSLSLILYIFMNIFFCVI